MSVQPFKQRDIKPCMCCGKRLAEEGALTFYRVKIEYLILNVGNLRQQAGLEMMFGGGVGAAAIAHVMGPDREMAAVTGEASGLVCLMCGAGIGLSEIYEKASSVGKLPDETGEEKEG